MQIKQAAYRGRRYPAHPSKSLTRLGLTAELASTISVLYRSASRAMQICIITMFGATWRRELLRKETQWQRLRNRFGRCGRYALHNPTLARVIISARLRST